MATSSTSAASSAASLTAPPTFSGVSKFAGSLQSVLTRAVGIASLPLSLDQQRLSDLQTAQNDLRGLDNAFTNLQQSIASLQSTITSGLLSASSSNSSVATATVGAGATAGAYTISVSDPGVYSTALSVAGTTPVADPTTQGISAGTTYNLYIGTTRIGINAQSSSLQDLANAINSQSNGQVQATLVNFGSTASPNYRLSLQTSSLTIDLLDLKNSSGTDLISSGTPGAPASYSIGNSDPITSPSRSITLSPGLTVNLSAHSASGASTTITVSNNAATLASAFSSFAGSYNAAVDVLSQYHGQNGGSLEGDSLIQTLTYTLNQLGNYSNGTPAAALANYGITLDKTGRLSVDTGTLQTAANANFTQLLNTLGSTTTGGFLKTAQNLLKGIEDPVTGAIKTEEKTFASAVITAQNTVANEQATVNQIQTNLTKQIALADSTIAELENQVSYVTGLFAQYTGATNTQSNGFSSL
jgi:flagellar hook-associated protein 2